MGVCGGPGGGHGGSRGGGGGGGPGGVGGGVGGPPPPPPPPQQPGAVPSLVIETLREVDVTRRCYRMVGGVLVERTVKEVLPALESNLEQISKILESLSQQLQAKGRELTEFREKHNIRLLGEDDPRPPPKEGAEGAKGGSAGVLVS
uniref:Prefoldin subunit 2 n=1 Tax=Anas platyrhynchos platyrhynchos TaxID=8840 RepID=A0A493T2D5_ANAPP